MIYLIDIADAYTGYFIGSASWNDLQPIKPSSGDPTSASLAAAISSLSLASSSCEKRTECQVMVWNHQLQSPQHPSKHIEQRTDIDSRRTKWRLLCISRSFELILYLGEIFLGRCLWLHCLTRYTRLYYALHRRCVCVYIVPFLARLCMIVAGPCTSASLASLISSFILKTSSSARALRPATFLFEFKGSEGFCVEDSVGRKYDKGLLYPLRPLGLFSFWRGLVAQGPATVARISLRCKKRVEGWRMFHSPWSCTDTHLDWKSKRKRPERCSWLICGTTFSEMDSFH